MSSRFNVAKRLFWRSLILLLWVGVARETTSLLFGQTPFSKPDSAALSSVVSSTAPRSFHPGLMRVDMSITTPKPTNWIGEITLSRGSFTDLVPLGFNATSGSDFFFSNSSQNSLTSSFFLIFHERMRSNFAGNFDGQKLWNELQKCL